MFLESQPRGQSHLAKPVQVAIVVPAASTAMVQSSLAKQNLRQSHRRPSMLFLSQSGFRDSRLIVADMAHRLAASLKFRRAAQQVMEGVLPRANLGDTNSSATNGTALAGSRSAGSAEHAKAAARPIPKREERRHGVKHHHPSETASSLYSHCFSRSASLTLPHLSSPLPSSHSLALSTGSSPPLPSSPPSATLPAAASASRPSSCTASPAHSHDYPALHFPSARPSPPTGAPATLVLLPRFTAPAQPPTLTHSRGTSPAVNPVSILKTSQSCPDHLNSTEADCLVRPSLTPTHSSPSQGRTCRRQKSEGASPEADASDSKQAVGPKLVRRVSFNSIVRVRRFIELPPDADGCCSDDGGSCANGISQAGKTEDGRRSSRN
ncbi:unnamed protein product [Closterium sp. NIES-53]